MKMEMNEAFASSRGGSVHRPTRPVLEQDRGIDAADHMQRLQGVDNAVPLAQMFRQRAQLEQSRA